VKHQKVPLASQQLVRYCSHIVSALVELLVNKNHGHINETLSVFIVCMAASMVHANHKSGLA
jgi:hypothetical protein